MKSRAMLVCVLTLGVALLAGCIYIGNILPIAMFTAVPTSGSGTQTAPLTVTFDPTGSNDPDGVLILFSWNFGDGQTASTTNLVAITHDYSVQSGATTVFTASLIVTDDDGATDTEIAEITVSSP